jgi:hypothetical protein
MDAVDFLDVELYYLAQSPESEFLGAGAMNQWSKTTRSVPLHRGWQRLATLPIQPQ